jgi:hypothetical protein
MLQAARPHTLLLSRETEPAFIASLKNGLVNAQSDTFIDFFDSDDPGSFEAGEGEVRFIVWQEATISKRALGTLRSSTAAMTIVFIHSALSDPERPDRRLASVVAHADESAIFRSLVQ